MNEVMEWAEELEKLWNNEELTEFAWKVTVLYNSSDYNLVSATMLEFKKRISK